MLLVILMWVRGLGHQDLGLGSQILVNITGAWAPPPCSSGVSDGTSVKEISLGFDPPLASRLSRSSEPTCIDSLYR